VSSLKGRLLVALPPLNDQNFNRTVVLMLEHTDDGALGVVLNRPSRREVSEILEAWMPLALAAPPAVVFGGGPVEPEAVIGLARGSADDDSAHWAPILDGLGTVDLTADPEELVQTPEALRLFLGYAGWGSGQLEGELAAGAWVVADFRLDDAFAVEPAELWRAVLRRQPGRVAWLANYPDDPSVN
jgi:putative transcriptional regulator